MSEPPEWMTEEVMGLCRFLMWLMVAVLLALFGLGVYNLAQ